MRQIDSAYHARAFASIQRGVTRGSTERTSAKWAYPPGTTVSARVPARIDIAGGWTDTPPQARLFQYRLRYGNSGLSRSSMMNYSKSPRGLDAIRGSQDSV